MLILRGLERSLLAAYTRVSLKHLKVGILLMLSIILYLALIYLLAKRQWIFLILLLGHQYPPSFALLSQGRSSIGDMTVVVASFDIPGRGTLSIILVENESIFKVLSTICRSTTFWPKQRNFGCRFLSQFFHL